MSLCSPVPQPCKLELVDFYEVEFEETCKVGRERMGVRQRSQAEAHAVLVYSKSRLENLQEIESNA